jgi:hypothetical protein
MCKNKEKDQCPHIQSANIRRAAATTVAPMMLSRLAT